MKIKNPNFKSSGDERIEFFKVEIGVLLSSLSVDQEFFSFDEIRSLVDKMNLVDADGVVVAGSDLTDGMIDTIANVNNITVIDE